MHEFTINAQRRPESGKTAAKRYRRQDRIPAVVYGHGHKAIPLLLEARELKPIFKSAGKENAIINLKLDDGQSIKALIREAQTEPIRNRLLHLDLLEIKMDERIKVKVPVETVGIPEGVKNQGGILEHILDTIEISCLPGDIPEKITVDLTPLKVGQSFHVGDIPADKFQVLTDRAAVVATVIAPIVEAAAPAEAEPAEAKEPEVISKGKKEEEEEA